MKLLLIKFGKAFNTIKRDGLLRGGRRAIQAGWGIAKSIKTKPADILFIAGGVGDSSRYGCQHQAEELQHHGLTCSVTTQDNPFLPRLADKYQVFIFHRTLLTPNLQKLIAEIKKQGRTIIFATDDLVFDARYFQYMDYLRNANAFEKKLYEKGVGEEILKDPHTAAAVTTTDYLKDKIAAYRQQLGIKGDTFQTFVSLNKLSVEDMQVADRLIEKKNAVAHAAAEEGTSLPGASKDLVRIGYFSGTISHNKDFETVTDGLCELLGKHGNLRLVIVGPLDVDSQLGQFAGQVEHLPFVPRKEHFANISKVDINISPLEKDNPFCEAKSELKFFEAGAVAVPTVASATQTFRQAIQDGYDGFVADSADEWREKLERLITDPELRVAMGQRAREKTIKRHTTTGQGNEAYYEFLKSRIKSHR